MDLSIGNVFPAPSVTARLQNQIGFIQNAARIAARRATNWLSRTGVWCGVKSEKAASGSCLSGELRRLQNEMLSRTGVRIALGAASSRVVAGTASRSAGHGAPQVVAAGRERAFLAPLSLRHLYGLPAATLRVLHANGMVTIGELQRVPKAVLQAEFGRVEGLRLWRSARGLDTPADGGRTASQAEPAADFERPLLSGALRQAKPGQAFLRPRGYFASPTREIVVQNAAESMGPPAR